MASRFQTVSLAAVLLTAIAVPAGGAALGDSEAAKQVYKVDSVIATAKGKVITIQAKGAVQSGGWTQAKLHLLHNDGHILTMEFVAAPPSPDMTVIDALVPMTANAVVRTSHAAKIVSVRVQATANEVTAQVLH
jgi:hypothetical protein